MERFSGRGGKKIREGWKDFQGKVERKSRQGGNFFRAEILKEERFSGYQKTKVEEFSCQRWKENQGVVFVKGESLFG